MGKKVLLEWKCGLCGSVQVSDSSQRHHMTMCECGESAVDLEEWYQRNMGKVIEIERKEVDD